MSVSSVAGNVMVSVPVPPAPATSVTFCPATA